MIGVTAGAERADQSLRPRCEDGATRITCNVSLGGSSSREPRSDATCPDKPARVSMVESNAKPLSLFPSCRRKGDLRASERTGGDDRLVKMVGKIVR